MGMTINLPELNISEEEIKLLLAIKLLDEEMISLGKAAAMAGYSEKAFAEILLHRGVSPIKYSRIDLVKELQNA